MARVIGPLMSQTAHGLIGERLTFSKRKTGQQVRFQRSNIDKKSFDQLRNREVYQDAYLEWNLLSVAEKNVWKAQAVGLELTGFNLFIKDYYMNTIRKVAEKLNIDGKVVANHDVYTVPAGMEFYPTELVVRGASTSEVETYPEGVFARKSDEFEITASELWVCLEDETSPATLAVFSIGSAMCVFKAGDVLQARIVVGSTSDTFLLDVYILGFLREV